MAEVGWATQEMFRAAERNCCPLLYSLPKCVGFFVVLPERLGREGDSQNLPTPNDNPDIQSMVIADLEKRRELGIRRYGTALQADNGRNPLLDGYEELLDLVCYWRQVLEEQPTIQQLRARIAELEKEHGHEVTQGVRSPQSDPEHGRPGYRYF